MPKPMINALKSNTQSGSLLNVNEQQRQAVRTNPTDKMQLDRLLRKSRSKEYLEALHKLDAGGHVHNQDKVNEIIDVIRNEFPEVEIQGVLLGFVSACYLGVPYEVHTLDMTESIVEHYKVGQQLPNGLEKARSLAIYGGYEFIEVYIDCCRCISSNGTVSVVKC